MDIISVVLCGVAAILSIFFGVKVWKWYNQPSQTPNYDKYSKPKQSVPPVGGKKDNETDDF